MNEVFAQLEGITGLNKPQLINYSMYGGVTLVMLGVGQVYITTMIGVLYPAFMSFVALETEDTEDDKLWLTYWVVYGAFQIVDQFAGFILALIPFYFFLKLLLMVYMFHPTTQGAKWVYDNILQKYVKTYRGQVEEAINNVQDQAADQFNKAKANVMGDKAQ